MTHQVSLSTTPKEQRCWELACDLKTFTTSEIYAFTFGISQEFIRKYLADLITQKIVRKTGDSKDGEVLYEVAVTATSDAPLLPPRQQDIKTWNAIWKAIRVLKRFDLEQVLMAAGTSRQATQTYLYRLSDAKYCKRFKSESGSWQYILIPARCKGSAAVQIKRNGELFDPNTRQVVWPLKQEAAA